MIYSPSRHTLHDNNSYLDTHFNVPKQTNVAFHVSKNKKSNDNVIEKPAIIIDDGFNVEEYSLKRKNITLDGIDSYLLQLPNVKALDLSFNKLTSIPHALPYNICALDISANPIRSFKSFINAPQAYNLIELKLCHNRISRYFSLTCSLTCMHTYYYVSVWLVLVMLNH